MRFYVYNSGDVVIVWLGLEEGTPGLILSGFGDRQIYKMHAGVAISFPATAGQNGPFETIDL